MYNRELVFRLWFISPFPQHIILVCVLFVQDDWYVLDYEPDNFVLVYYRGSNDAWDGYGGAFLYTKSASFDPALTPRLSTAMQKAQLPYSFNDFTITDNSCRPQTESPTVLREQFAKRLLITEEQQLQEQLTALRNAATNTLFNEEQEAARAIQNLEREFGVFQKEVQKEVQEVEGVFLRK